MSMSGEFPTSPPTSPVGPPVSLPAGATDVALADASPGRSRSPRGGWGRSVAALIVAVLAGLLVCGGAVAHWASTTIVSTSGFATAVGPLSAHPEVQQQLTSTISSRVLSSLQTAVDEAPFPVSMLSALVPQLSGPIESAVGSAVRSDAAEQAWQTSVVRLHDDTIAAITGSDSSVSIGEGTATIDLNSLRGPLIDGLDAPDAIKSVLQQVNLGSVTVVTGVSPWVLELGVRWAGSWQLLVAVGVLLCALAGLLARRTGAGLLMAGVCVAAAGVLAGPLSQRALAGRTTPDALSRSLAEAITGSIEPALTADLRLVVMSGAALALVGAVLWLVGFAWTSRRG